MTAVDLPPRLAAIGLVLAREMPLVLEAAVSLLESMARALDAARLDDPRRIVQRSTLSTSMPGSLR